MVHTAAKVEAPTAGFGPRNFEFPHFKAYLASYPEDTRDTGAARDGCYNLWWRAVYNTPRRYDDKVRYPGVITALNVDDITLTVTCAPPHSPRHWPAAAASSLHPPPRFAARSCRSWL